MNMLSDTPTLSMQITELIPTGQLTAATIDPLDKKSSVPCMTFMMPQQVAQAEAWVSGANAQGRNCYFHTNISDVTSKRLSKLDVKAARFAWADIDPDIKQFGSYEKARGYLNSLIPSLMEHASIIIDSGNGLQVLYRLAPALDIRDQESKEEYEIVNRAVAKRWNADSTQDCSRILRLPGTLNYPSQAKVDKGYPSAPSIAKIIYCSANEYTLESIQIALAISPELIEQARTEYHAKSKGIKSVQAIVKIEISEQLKDRFEHFLESNPSAKARYLGSTQGLVDKSGSAMDMGMATSMIRGGFNIDQIRALLLDWQFGSKNNDRTQDRYWVNIRQNSYARDEEITQEKLDAFWAQVKGNPVDRVKTNFTEPTSDELVEPLDAIDLINQEYVWDNLTREIYDIKNGLYVPAPKFYMHYDNVSYKPSEDAKATTLGRGWVKSPKRRCVKQLVLAPGKPATLKDGSLNTWRGFTVEPEPGDVTPFIDLINFVLPNKAEREYSVKWLAKMIQEPGAKFLVSLVVWSIEEGVGKGLLFETVGSLLHQRHFKVVGNEVFNDQFTEWQSQKIFVIADEVSSADKRSTADRIKGWITATENNINIKNTAKYSEQNLIKYVFLSNHPDAVYLNDKDRRFFVAEAPDKKLPDDIRKNFVNWIKSGGKAALIDYLLSQDTSQFDPTAPAPMSQSKMGMLDSNKSDLEQWVENALLKAQAKNHDLISTEDLAAHYNLGSRPTKCSGKTVATILKRMGYKKLAKKAKFDNGTRKGLFSTAAKFNTYSFMSETEIARHYKETIF
ncbi:MAG: RepB family DNA primase [Polynucleobacter sp.]|nr:RepB family DNA primase [Polynucleobacter sp.]